MPRGIVRPIAYADQTTMDIHRALLEVLDFVHLHQMLGSEDKQERDYAREELKVWELSPLEKRVLEDFAWFHVGAQTDWYGTSRNLTVELRAEDGSGVRRFTGEVLGFGVDPCSRHVKHVAISVDPEVAQESS